MKKTPQLKQHHKLYKNPVTTPAIAAKPNQAALILNHLNGKNPIATAICNDLPVRSYEMDELTTSIHTIVIQLVADCGSKEVTQEDISYLTGRLIRKIVKDYIFITPSEIRLAFENGVYGDYGDYFGVNLKTCLQFIGGYAKQRSAYINKQNMQRDVERINRENEIWKQNRINKAIVMTNIRKAG